MSNQSKNKSSEKEEKIDGDYFHGSQRYFDEASEHTIVKVYSGDCYIARGEKEMMMTVLGSCISACIRDPIIGIGGMNHFLLPSTSNVANTSARYGAFAMEELINGIIKKGGVKNRLEIKIFGGGNITDSSAQIGSRNCEFITEYLKKEGLNAATQDIGGTSPRRIHYYPDTGKVMMRKMNREEDLENVRHEEDEYQKQVENKSQHGDEGDVELF